MNLNNPKGNNQVTQGDTKRLAAAEQRLDRIERAIYSLAKLETRLAAVPRASVHEDLLTICQEQAELHSQVEADQAARLQQLDEQREAVKQETRLAPEEVPV